MALPGDLILEVMQQFCCPSWGLPIQREGGRAAKVPDPAPLASSSGLILETLVHLEDGRFKMYGQDSAFGNDRLVRCTKYLPRSRWGMQMFRALVVLSVFRIIATGRDQQKDQISCYMNFVPFSFPDDPQITSLLSSIFTPNACLCTGSPLYNQSGIIPQGWLFLLLLSLFQRSTLVGTALGLLFTNTAESSVFGTGITKQPATHCLLFWCESVQTG